MWPRVWISSTLFYALQGQITKSFFTISLIVITLKYGKMCVKREQSLPLFVLFKQHFTKKNSRLQSDLNLYSLQTTWPSPRLLVWNVMRAAVGKCQDAHEIEFHLPMCYAVIYGPKRYGKLRYTGTRPDGRLSDDLRFTSWLRCCYKDVTNLWNATCCIHLKTLKTTNGK